VFRREPETAPSLYGRGVPSIPMDILCWAIAMVTIPMVSPLVAH